ncbi:hypothetical protein [Asanoa ferruginea]|nr:hypothetical protein [Asanoa ferruginea]
MAAANLIRRVLPSMQLPWSPVRADLHTASKRPPMIGSHRSEIPHDVETADGLLHAVLDRADLQELVDRHHRARYSGFIGLGDLVPLAEV